MLNINAFSQLTVKTVEETHNYQTAYKFWRGYDEIRHFASSYILLGANNNQFEDAMHSIVLGETKEEAIQSLYDLQALKRVQRRNSCIWC